MWPNCDAHITVAYVKEGAVSERLLATARQELVIQGRRACSRWLAEGLPSEVHRADHYAAVCILVWSRLHESLHSLRAVLGRHSEPFSVMRKEAFHVSFRSPRGCSFDACMCGR